MTLLDNNIFVAHSIYNNKGIYTLFLGSGISRPSGIPTGWDITIDLINRIGVLNNEDCTQDPIKWFEEYFNEPADYSNILEKLTNTPEERINLLRPYIEPSGEELEHGLKQPTKAHHQIAQLVKRGYIKVIITTNFDRLIENALRSVGIEPTVISNPTHIEHAIPLIHSNITILKINGDYLDNKFLNIKTELSGYDKRIKQLVCQIFEDFGLITCGWSGKWDLALIDILKSSNKFRFGNFFTYMTGPEKEMEEIAHFRKGTLMQIKNADHFFTEVTEYIDALERYETHPLTKELALARLKKYLSIESYKIQLHDLFIEQVEATYNQVNDDVDYSKPTVENIKKNLNFYCERCDTLASLLTEGVYWGKDYHYEIWIKGIIKFSYPKDQTHSWNVWSELQYFPSVFFIYASGMTALLQKNFIFLMGLLSLKVVSNRTRERQSIIYNSHPRALIDPKNLNEVIGKSQYVPMNEFLFRQLLPKFQSKVPAEREYEDLFDYFEIIFALFYLKIAGLNGFPVGRFRYRRDYHHLFPTLFESIIEEKENHELVKGGLFTYKELEDIYTFLIERVNQMHD